MAVGEVSDDTIVQLFLCDLLAGTIYNKDGQLYENIETTTEFNFTNTESTFGEYRGKTTILTLTENATKVRQSF